MHDNDYNISIELNEMERKSVEFQRFTFHTIFQMKPILFRREQQAYNMKRDKIRTHSHHFRLSRIQNQIHAIIICYSHFLFLLSFSLYAFLNAIAGCYRHSLCAMCLSKRLKTQRVQGVAEMKDGTKSFQL